VLPTHLPVPRIGNILVNAFVLLAEEPVLLGYRAGDDGPDFIAALESVMPLRDLWWILLTHDDADHIGSLRRIIELAPQARGDPRAGRPSDEYMVAAAAEPRPCRGAGGSAPRHDRSLVAIRPPVFDKPTTTGIYDECTGRLFSLDSLGAILSELTRHLLESALVYHVDPWPRCQRCDRPACSPLTCRPPAAASTASWRSCARSGMPSLTSLRATRRSTTSSSSWSLRLRTDVATGRPRRSLK
jgi:hypothetical protein